MISESKSRISESRSRLISESQGKKSVPLKPGENLKNIKDGPGDVLAYAEYVKAGN